MLEETGRKLRFLLLCLLSIIFVCFAVVNRTFISVSLFPLPYSAEMPTFVFAVLCFALGIIVGGGFISAKLSKIKRLLKHEHKHVMALQNEVSAMNMHKNELLPAVAAKK